MQIRYKDPCTHALSSPFPYRSSDALFLSFSISRLGSLKVSRARERLPSREAESGISEDLYIVTGVLPTIGHTCEFDYLDMQIYTRYILAPGLSLALQTQNQTDPVIQHTL